MDQNIRVAIPPTLSATPTSATGSGPRGQAVIPTISSQTAAASGVAAAASSGNCSTARPYGPPNALTLIGAAAVANENIKMQGPDGVVESVLGSQGTVVFDVSTLPNRAGLALGGATLLGIDALRARLMTFAMLVNQINYDGGIALQMRQPINILTANVDGSTGKQVLNVDQFINNMQQIQSLITITTPVLLTSNTCITMTKLATANIGLTLSQMSAIPYNDPSQF